MEKICERGIALTESNKASMIHVGYLDGGKQTRRISFDDDEDHDGHEIVGCRHRLGGSNRKQVHDGLRASDDAGHLVLGGLVRGQASELGLCRRPWLFIVILPNK